MAPKTRSEKLKRLVNVQRHLEKIAEGDLAAATRQRLEIGESMTVVIEAIGSVDTVHSLFTHHYSDRFGRLMQKDQQLQGMQKLHEMKLMRERAKGDRLEDGMKEARTLEDREIADNDIYDLIDQKIAMDTTASSKLQKS